MWEPKGKMQIVYKSSDLSSRNCTKSVLPVLLHYIWGKGLQNPTPIEISQILELII